MPAGKPWFTKKCQFDCVPNGALFWHVYREPHLPLAANPVSSARMSLRGTHAMFYVASDLSGALWETVLRAVAPDDRGRVAIEASSLVGYRAIKVRLLRDDLPLLDLTSPALRKLFVSDSAEAFAVAQMLGDPDHANTHDEARRLLHDLHAVGVEEMPVLAWGSRQHHASKVFLAYQPPMDEGWWATEGDPIHIDDSSFGHVVLRGELAQCGFLWAPGDTDTTEPEP